MELERLSERELTLGLGMEVQNIAKTQAKHNTVLFEGDDKAPSVIETVRQVHSFTKFLQSFRRIGISILTAVLTAVALQGLLYRKTSDIKDLAVESKEASEKAVEVARETKRTTVAAVVKTQKLIEKKVKPAPTIKPVPKASQSSKPSNKGWRPW